MRFTDFFRQTYSDKLSNKVSVTYRDEDSDTNNLGVLSGVDLDSDLFGGYIYYWGNGYLDFMVYNLKENKDEIPITVIDTKDFKNDTIIQKVLEYFIEKSNN